MDVHLLVVKRKVELLTYEAVPAGAKARRGRRAGRSQRAERATAAAAAQRAALQRACDIPLH